MDDYKSISEVFAALDAALYAVSGLPGNDDSVPSNIDVDEIEFTLDELTDKIEDTKSEWDKVLDKVIEDMDHKDNFDRARVIL